MKAYIYKLKRKDYEYEVYIGQTIRPLSNRLACHFNAPSNKEMGEWLYKHGRSNIEIVIVEEYDYENKIEVKKLLNEREIYWFKYYKDKAEYKCFTKIAGNASLSDGKNCISIEVDGIVYNSISEARRKTGKYIRTERQIVYSKKYRSENKDKKRETDRLYRESHPEELKKKKKYYYESNKDKIADKGKLYRENNKDKKRQIDKNYAINNREKLKEYKHQYYLKNKEDISLEHKEYRDAHKDKLAEKHKLYVQNNEEKLKEYKQQYYLKNKEEINKKNRENYLKNKEQRKKKNRENYLKNKEEINSKRKEERLTRKAKES